MSQKHREGGGKGEM
jgi:hypothetical protein